MAEITVVSQAGSVPLSLSPSSISLYKGKSVTLEATGGTGEYSFTLEQAIGGTGELLIDSSYTAPSDTGGTALIRVTDELGDTADASVSVSFTTPSVPDVNYGSLSIVHTGSTLGGGNINGSFSFSNDGSDDGSQSINWIVYYSEDTSIGSGDTIVSQGELGALHQGEGSGDISFSGTWPYAATDTTYYLIAELSAEDDISSSNDTGSVAVDLEAVIAKNIDYDIQELSLITPSTDVKYYQISFHIHNIGGDDGEDYVSWGAYYSEDDNWDEGDINFANGTLDILIDGSSSEYTQFEDTAWSYPAGTYYIIIKISADEDINETNNYESAGPYTVE